ncbi:MULTISPECIES: 8-amino-7-oxononanoate synthase [unclassified Tolypothrix]|uniref:8-amino-7-oxononanoate synthase n=1 Tax=unclassified Tolypothrix TaxID=2649714 RepID=UPI0005EAA4ED|nr:MULTISPECIES: 8-amino-7-oxononanoate synthase [unclassified Tolypothrix]BAY89480.1 8-amino-7-oxononanoate synthase [Microchaete diplosiphon NIES-3275]EKF01950.1 8-amino-7-oxononanoate synthase [Tolypothrix sp. PCC 7601]MBE9087857.1 8-amino-7-oxononanoate synthase [Tolypothrix sp. LEGE 11397]UYD23765.1 8-amino-7-oxononanoate synthase [Tolypothrix sp. PCC 7712]UYD34010.1 8-amino-7-oxononanoate synthase [Tolypothrix sp. PCC 7601]
MVTDPYAWLEQSLTTIRKADWYRSVQTINGTPGATVLLGGREVINFASNDYLGLAGDRRLIEAGVVATQEFGTGSTGSRLLSGHRELHRQLESAIASLKQTEDAIVFSSGYLANLGAIAALVGKRDLILSDQYNHSSLKNGAILSGAVVIEYPHCDITALKNQLIENRQNYRRCLILTDSVFSMDGDLCPLPELLDLADEFSCMLLVDEAHATGVLGKTGAGCVEHFGCTGKQLIQIGTLSKALGSLGGYVAGSATLIDFLRNRAPTWIYTTALSPADTAAALTAIEIVQQEPQRRTQLWANVDYLKKLMQQQVAELKLLPSASPILCFQLPSATAALAVGKSLQEAGIFAPAIRPPTVPTSRIRISAMATHQATHIDKLVAALGEFVIRNEG